MTRNKLPVIESLNNRDLLQGPLQSGTGLQDSRVGVLVRDRGEIMYENSRSKKGGQGKGRYGTVVDRPNPDSHAINRTIHILFVRPKPHSPGPS